MVSDGECPPAFQVACKVLGCVRSRVTTAICRCILYIDDALRSAESEDVESSHGAKCSRVVCGRHGPQVLDRGIWLTVQLKAGWGEGLFGE